MAKDIEKMGAKFGESLSLRLEDLGLDGVAEGLELDVGVVEKAENADAIQQITATLLRELGSDADDAVRAAKAMGFAWARAAGGKVEGGEEVCQRIAALDFLATNVQVKRMLQSKRRGNGATGGGRGARRGDKGGNDDNNDDDDDDDDDDDTTKGDVQKRATPFLLSRKERDAIRRDVAAMAALRDAAAAAERSLRVRQDIMLKRLDLTVHAMMMEAPQSGGRGAAKAAPTRSQEEREEMATTIKPLRDEIAMRRQGLSAEDVLAARAEPQVLRFFGVATPSGGESASSAAIRRVVIGVVPDRGGRANEKRPKARDLMPRWRKREGGGGGGRGGGRAGGRGGGHGGRSGRGGRGGRSGGGRGGKRSRSRGKRR